MIANLLTTALLLLASLPAQTVRRAPASCGLAFHVIDATNRHDIPLAAVYFVPYGLSQTTDACGWATWNTREKENFYPQGRSFAVWVAAPGYEPATRTFATPRPPACCDEGSSLFSFDVPLRPALRLTNANGGIATAVADTAATSGYYRHDYMGYEEKPCCKGPAVVCIDVVNGQPAGKVDYTDKNKKIDKTSLKANFGLGGGLKDLASFGFVLDGESSAEKSIEIDALIGDRNFDPTLCGYVCIRKILTTLKYDVYWVEAGRAWYKGRSTIDAVTGICVSAANLHKCTDAGTFDACGVKQQ